MPKIAGVPLYRLLADRYRGGCVERKVFVYAAGGYYYPDKDLSALQQEMRGYLKARIAGKTAKRPVVHKLAR